MEIARLKEKFGAAYEKILTAENILLVTHERPDGDGLATLCALSVFLDSLEKNQTIFCADAPPDFFSYLPNINKLISGNLPMAEPKTRPVPPGAIHPSQEGNNFSAFDLIIVLDCGSLSRTKLAEEIIGRNKNQFVIEFDHHPKTEDYSDLEIRAPLSSAAEVLYYFFHFNRLPFSKDIADCLLTGIMTDTGNLLFGAVTPQTIEITSIMIINGATLPKITRRTSQNKSLAAMKAWGKILDNLKLNKKYNIAYSVLTFAEIANLKKEFGGENLFDAATDILNNIEGVKAVIFLREEEPGKIRGSLRTKDSAVNVARLATYLGGGGHPKAAAFRFPGSIIKTETGWKIV
ncbi:MAG: bifunctional oligoribonuclease/PAP phosphatase NrnA [Patescibacteria group bacterium]|nr:bifunctional oligoribonuclease/PAP phosphatase NrnA [Patescibacteria group bacterium]